MNLRSIDILDEVMDKTGEYLEMMSPEHSSQVLIDYLCQMIVRERELKEIYKKMYMEKIGQTQRINS